MCLYIVIYCYKCVYIFLYIYYKCDFIKLKEINIRRGCLQEGTNELTVLYREFEDN